MTARVVTLIGAGNIRVAPIVLATLAEFFPESPLHVHLFDANEERLDLMDRLARTFFDITRNEATVKSSSELADVLPDSTEVIIALNEDGSRRMVGRQLSTAAAVTDAAIGPTDVYSGDFNRPTPLDRLSDHTRMMLEVPAASEGSREEAVAAAFELVAATGWPSDARVLNLTRGLQVPIETWDWPSELSDASKHSMPHRILRWIHHDENIGDLLTEGRESRFRAWLEQR